MEAWHIPIILLAGVFAGIVNTLAGGGSLLTLPLLILLLGLPPTVANGTNRVAVFIQCVFAYLSFEKRGIRQNRTSWILAAPSILGSILGAYLALLIPGEVFNRILAVLMVVMVGFIVWKPMPSQKKPLALHGLRKMAALFVFFWIGVFGGLFQVGTGFFITIALPLLCGMDLVKTASVKVFVIGIYITFSLLIFAWNGEVNWLIGLTLALGNGLGGWVGSKIAVEKGEKPIRIVLLASVIALAIKLFFFR
ncbi:MAG: sulfite exporter TauE/SafE family protein [bacterium]|jgi:uncharacterized membrane protein YfcA|nr:sulfite exporter TauE/SafE family protein [bacterium]